MIFKHFFRPKHQDPNPQVRIQAIANLTPEETQHKSQLHELAFNDEDPNVNLAALTRLNSFALWCKMAETAKSERVKKRAQTTVENALFEQGTLKISDRERHTFIAECKSNALLEKLLQLPSLQNDDSGLLMGVLQKLNKPHVTKQLFLNAQNEKVQFNLLPLIKDEATLNKALKRTPFESIKATIAKMLTEIEEAKLKPIEIEKDAKLVLSQMLALKDKQDYATIKQQLSAFAENFNLLQKEFGCLKADLRTQLNERFDEIYSKVNGLIEQLAPSFHAAEQFNTFKAQLDGLASQVMSIVSSANQELSQDVEKVTLGAVEDYEHALQTCQHSLAEIKQQLPEQEKSLHTMSYAISKQIIQCRSTLERLPEFKKAVGLGKEFIAQFKRLKPPTDVSQISASQEYLNEQTQHWKSLSDSYGSGWPKELEVEWQQCRKAFNQGLKELKAEVKQNESRCRAKLRTIDSLISQGKYHAAMGLYEKVIIWYAQLPERNQEFISRQFLSVKEQVENLKDWQQYIAQPRKPAILKEAEIIALNPLPIDQQVSEVKHLRSEWNSLGNTGTEADIALNHAFDLVIEKAFEPCRLHFAEMETQREENAQQKYAVIEQLKALQTEEHSINQLIDQVNQLQKRWKTIGKVDYKILDTLNQQYDEGLKPLKSRISQFNQENADAKRELISKAQKLLETENVFEAIDQAKRLQIQWKDIGQAGRKHENALWNEFRNINDQLFAKRNEIQNSNKQALQQKTDELEEQFAVIQKDALNVESLANVEQVTSELRDFANTLANDEANHNRIERKVTQLENKLLSKKQSLVTDEKRKILDCVFTLLEPETDNEVTNDLLEQLPQAWKQAYQSDSAPQYSRQEIAVLLDIIDSKDSPKGDLELRKNLQLQLMTDKLQHGEELNKNELLLQWIQHGSVEDKDADLQQRVRSHFID
ncbi:DUF349 domain-containing protein [Aliiglaciecola lipolytica]|uniref:DUF349 domain-containing protein n=1 Tax=Aliiglaciecola lipolytica E3 TaxID=1127673 RepID=K6X2S1_9ALTE|nr:DUF349 domain-containing protein [Aliiglaciecola lipolytica]GAC14934.1 hypothetical protein GLIP_2307 [Aliiglaciecola lipolytica E3]